MIIGCGPRLSNEVSLIIQRTITLIEHDMGHKNGTTSTSQHTQTPIMSNHIKQEAYDSVPSHHQQVTSTPNGIETTPIDASTGTRVPPADNPTFYDPSIATATTPYHHLAYADQGSVPAQNGNTMQSYDPTDSTQYLYAATAAAAAAAAATTAGSAHQAASNPLVAFASQATQHVSHQAGDEWARAMAGQNTWHDWTAAMADSQDRYSANALLTLGNGQRSDGPGDMSVGGDAAVAASNHGGQWPMLIFHDGTGSVSGG